MAFNGKLLELKVGANYVEFPLQYIKYSSYKATPDQRMESSANRATSGKLVRQTVSHTATKVEFETPPITNADLAAIMTRFTNAFTDALQRKLTARYYDTITDAYKTGDFYVPDIETSITNVDVDKKIIYYDSIRFALIEY